jgi:hypothetical protein
VPYSLSSAASRQISLADATRVAHLAFDAWNNAACHGGSPNVQTYDNGPIDADAAATDCGIVMCDPSVHDPVHVVLFRDEAWPHNDPTNTLALTTVTFGVDSAEIFDADIEINSAEQTLSAEEPPPPGAFDLQAILTHEAGHFYGLAHATDTRSIMYAFYKKGATTLTADDVDGVCTTNPPLARASGCGCGAVGLSPGGWVLAAGGSVLVAILVRRRGRAGLGRP